MDNELGFQEYYDKVSKHIDKFDKEVVCGIEVLVSSIKQKS
ncbi:MAG: hypothetical protein ACI9XU_001186 [Arenicella sp.]|jgi:hypothetical protein